MDRDRVFDGRLAEHLSARDELLGAINNQHLALTFGTAALVAMFGAGFIAGSNEVAPAIFFAVLPLSWWILAMWLGEVVRMLRAVEFCTEQEALINAEMKLSDPEGRAVLRWESWRQDAGKPWRTITWTYLSVGLFLGLTDLAALACGTIWSLDKSHWTMWVVVLVPALVIVVGIDVARRVLATFQIWGVANIGMPKKPITELLFRVRPSRRSREDQQ
jgi:hypothetical protein